MKPSVLFVDDDQRLLDAIRRKLGARYFELFFARDVPEAVDVLHQHPIDAVVSDEQMPGSCGTELMTYIQKKWPQVVKIVLTGKATVVSASRAAVQGQVFKYLEKPVPAEELEKIIRQGLLRRELLHANRGMSDDEARALVASIASRA